MQSQTPAPAASMKVRLTKSVIVKGLGHCEAGEVVEVPVQAGRALVGAASAELYDTDGETAPGKVPTVRIEDPRTLEPQATRISSAPDKPAPGKGGRTRAQQVADADAAK